jgi:hypothetical protein
MRARVDAEATGERTMQGHEDEAAGESAANGDDIRPQKGGEAGTTRFGMEDGDNSDVPATGVDPERQSPDRK